MTQWLTLATSTDTSLQTAKTHGKEAEIAKLEGEWKQKIFAFGVMLAKFDKSSLPKIIQNDFQLSQIRKNDEPTVLKALIMLIGLTCDNLQVPRMSSFQMVDAAREILKNFYYFRMEEVAYAFNQGRTGHYGKIYNRIDLEILSEWLTAYDIGERLTFCEIVRKNQQRADRSTEEVRQSYEHMANGGLSVPQQLSQQEREKKTVESKKEQEYRIWRQNYLREKQAKEGTSESRPPQPPDDAY